VLVQPLGPATTLAARTDDRAVMDFVFAHNKIASVFGLKSGV
jgi:hypothetical protein